MFGPLPSEGFIGTKGFLLLFDIIGILISPASTEREFLSLGVDVKRYGRERLYVVLQFIEVDRLVGE